MNVIPGSLIVKECVALSKAVASDINNEDTNDLTENFLDSMSVDYPQVPRHKRFLVTENPADEGTNSLTPDGQDKIL